MYKMGGMGVRKKYFSKRDLRYYKKAKLVLNTDIELSSLFSLSLPLNGNRFECLNRIVTQNKESRSVNKKYGKYQPSKTIK